MKTVLILFFAIMPFFTNAQTDICKIAMGVKSNYDLFKNKNIMNSIGDNRCSRVIIDSLESNAVLSDSIAILILDRIAKQSDGALSDFIMDKTVNIYFINPVLLIKWLYQHPDNSLEKLLVYGLSMNISMRKEDERIKIEKFSQEVKKNLTQGESIFLKNTLKKIDPKIWD